MKKMFADENFNLFEKQLTPVFVLKDGTIYTKNNEIKAKLHNKLGFKPMEFPKHIHFYNETASYPSINIKDMELTYSIDEYEYTNIVFKIKPDGNYIFDKFTQWNHCTELEMSSDTKLTKNFFNVNLNDFNNIFFDINQINFFDIEYLMKQY